MSKIGFTDMQLNERLLKALAKQEFTQPTPVQAATIPVVMQGRDILVGAETGSGKTAAYLLPILHRIMSDDAPDTATRVLILLPTRELARQVMKHCTDLMRFSRIQAGLITGGAELKYQTALLRKNPEIVIATPGRIVEHLSRNSIDFSDLEVLVLDEADRMLDLGFSEDMLRIAEACKPGHQSLLYSATLGHQGVSAVAQKVLNDPEKVILNRDKKSHEGIIQQAVLADDIKHKKQLLARLLEKEPYEKALVFSNTRDMAGQLGGFLSYSKIRTAVLHGEMDQLERNRVMNLFRRGHVDVLVATDVASRGLDVQGIDLVINFDMARDAGDHVHRVGRTGRAGEQGVAISFVTSTEWNLMASIARYLKSSFERRVVPGLEAAYKGPKKVKASGKAASTKKRSATGKKSGDKKGSATDKGKLRHRDKKSVGKRRKPSDVKPKIDLGDGLAPFKKKPAPKTPEE